MVLPLTPILLLSAGLGISHQRPVELGQLTGAGAGAGAGSTYPGRLVLGKHPPGVIVEVVQVAGMFCLTKAVNKA